MPQGTRVCPELCAHGVALPDGPVVAFTPVAMRSACTMPSPLVAAINAHAAPPRTKPSNYPEPFASMMAGRTKRPIGDLYGLTNFGVNLTRLAPGAISALFHRHTRQDELVYVVEGRPTLVTEGGRQTLEPGMVFGFKAGGTAHQLINETAVDVVLLEVGDRTTGDEVVYPRDDIEAVMSPEGKWQFAHKDGTPY